MATKTKPSDQFDGIIGQKGAKKKISFYLKGYNASKILPHIMFVAPKGCGKTMLAKATGRNLVSTEDSTKPKTFLEINCSTIKNIKQFFNQIVIPHVHQKEVTILLDECSELPRDVSMALLSILNPNSDNRNEFSFEDYTIDFDFRRHSFLFATTEAQQVFHALMDRCERIDLEEYSYSELGRILRLNLDKYEMTIEDSLLKEIAPILRGNARAAQKMGNSIRIYLEGEHKKHFDKKDWETLQDALSILPLGLSPIELQILRALGEKKDNSLTYLAAKTGLTKACVQRDFELYLQKHNLMEISTAGRNLTEKGHLYLKKLDEKNDHEKK